MLLDAPTLDLGDAEAKIAFLLRGAVDVESNGQHACDQFGIVLARVLRALPSNRQARYWDLDDLACDAAARAGDVVTLRGTSTWLAGGSDCDRFRLDVALDQGSLLYSYKFTNSVTGSQILYVGKTPDAWLINGP
jgi:hypothetical protein